MKPAAIFDCRPGSPCEACRPGEPRRSSWWRAVTPYQRWSRFWSSASLSCMAMKSCPGPKPRLGSSRTAYLPAPFRSASLPLAGRWSTFMVANEGQRKQVGICDATARPATSATVHRGKDPRETDRKSFGHPLNFTGYSKTFFAKLFYSSYFLGSHCCCSLTYVESAHQGDSGPAL